MMPRLVFVHGIGGLRDTGRELAEWTDALARGMRDAGHPERAARLNAEGAGGVSLAYYADLFVQPEAQGAGEVAGEGAAEQILADLLVELVAALGSEHSGSTAPRDGAWQRRERILAHASAEAETAGQAQGGMSVLRRALNVATTLMALKPWRGVAHWATPKLMVRDLAQVSRYLARGESDASGVTLDARIRRRLHEALGDEPAVVVAHSLGTVVALEALHGHPERVPLLVTLGSPLSMRTVVRPRLLPQPPSTPGTVERWLNFWDKDDIIAVRPHLERDIVPNASGVGPRSRRTDADGVWVHSAGKYLAQAAVAGPVAQALASAERRTAS
ncbi:alpha/beta hydrolase [Streptomyces sp. NBC_00876]|uniref:alpha/beta fold hydrolase n=1 Tax=Streptomyces sp. NBC_00876 TaxID=2975853 RepID=UPI003864635C|nr:alpha/beta hydrolase [Streptomyces sp. NBC_00876]